MAGIYLHIPFCKTACHYCDFHFSTNLSLKDEMVEALIQEIEMQKNYIGNEQINTIYFGGGTPSLLSASQLNSLILKLYETFSVTENPEITLEANPDDLSYEKLSQLKDCGINRLSIGIQSFDDEILKFLNRAHSSDDALKCIEDARSHGFKNISVDLIYAIPGQDENTWKRNIQQAINLNPEHISSYSLTIEEKTVFGKWSAIGKLKPTNDEQTAQQLELLVNFLEHAGYDQYEVSNFGKPEYYSKHNSSYWKQEKYLGIGPSAHSYNGLTRQYNMSNNHHYVKAIKENRIPSELEILTREDKINEYLLTTLRTRWGCNLTKLKREFDYDLQNIHGRYLNDLFTKNLAEVNGSILILSKSGKMLADKIASDLFLLKE